MADLVLEVRNVDKIFGEGETAVYALKNVSFSVKKGEFILIVGSSGSGKSTLLNMIGLLDRPTNGQVLIDGVDTSNLNDNQISLFRNSKLGFIFQFSNLNIQFHPRGNRRGTSSTQPHPRRLEGAHQG